MSSKIERFGNAFATVLLMGTMFVAVMPLV